MKLSGNTDRKRAVIATINELDRVKPGFMEAIKARVRSAVGTPQKGLSSMFMGDWIDDIVADLDAGYISDKYLPPETSPADEENWWSSALTTITDAAKTVIPAYFAYEKEQDWAEIQLERAKRGQAPLRSAGYGAPATQFRVTHDIPKGAATRALGLDSGTMNQLLIGVAVIGGLFFLSK